MAGAREELKAAVEGLDEPDAELLLSLIHLLRAVDAGGGPPTGSGASLDRKDLTKLLLWSVLGGRADADAVHEALLSRLETRAWLGLTEQSLARDWARPEEDEAWADL